MITSKRKTSEPYSHDFQPKKGEEVTFENGIKVSKPIQIPVFIRYIGKLVALAFLFAIVRYFMGMGS